MHLANSVGCDSAAILVLTVNPTSTSTKSLSICPGALPYVWNSLTFTAAGTQTAHLSNSAGCDSAATLILTVSSTINAYDSVALCSGNMYVFNGHILTQQGIYTDTLTATGGCDSIISLYLTISNLNDTATVSGSVCKAEQTGAIYQWLTCNGQPVTGATLQTYRALSSGSYQCIVTFDNCSDTTNCVNAIVNGITTITGYNFSLYPNPNTGNFEIDFNYPMPLNVRIVNSLGSLVKETKLTRTSQFDITGLAPGVYQVMILNNDELLKVIKVVKQ